eukprot:1352658-Pleurochrysis_carterae.AAC.4
MLLHACNVKIAHQRPGAATTNPPPPPAPIFDLWIAGRLLETCYEQGTDAWVGSVVEGVNDSDVQNDDKSASTLQYSLDGEGETEGQQVNGGENDKGGSSVVEVDSSSPEGTEGAESNSGQNQVPDGDLEGDASADGARRRSAGSISSSTGMLLRRQGLRRGRRRRSVVRPGERAPPVGEVWVASDAEDSSFG